MSNYASLGAISSGTLRKDDLIPTFAYELRSLAEAETPVDMAHIDLCNEAEALKDYDSDEAATILEELEETLQEYAPPYAYFGANEWDGALFGFWLQDMEEIKREILDSGGMVVSDTSEVPGLHYGEVLLVNDHGNCTLYVKGEDGTLSELWAVV